MGEGEELGADGGEVGELGGGEEALGLEPLADFGHGLAGDAYFLGDGVVHLVGVGDEALVDFLFDVGQLDWAGGGLLRGGGFGGLGFEPEALVDEV